MDPTDAARHSDPIAERAEPSAVLCPECGHAFFPADAGPVLECPACHNQFFAAADDEAAPDEDSSVAAAEAEEKAREADLDAAKIKQVAVLRRGLYRTRSYVIIGVVGLIVGAAQLVFLAAQHVYVLGWDRKPIGFLFAAVACLIAAAMLRRRLPEIDRELRETVQPEPATPPDLSTLSDGSQRWKVLETMGQAGSAKEVLESPDDSVPRGDLT